ncbi:hypothetical protein K438DRAFT_1960478 [Mycena galopus ATCC 62051]|nr:hypothetical protein K438DRAFT_1960478 [Mycena galopus ATCC 62051]
MALLTTTIDIEFDNPASAANSQFALSLLCNWYNLAISVFGVLARKRSGDEAYHHFAVYTAYLQHIVRM